jgi:WD40 repeat protein
MTRTTCRNSIKVAGAVFAALILAAAPAAAKQHSGSKTNRTLCEKTLPNGKTTDLFLRRSNKGGLYLYIASANGTLAIYDVSQPADPRELNTLALSSDKPTFQIRSVSDYDAIASGAPDASQSLTVLDLANAPSVEITKTLKNVDAYTIDGETNTLYVAQRGKLFVIQIDHPITREAEIWEQSYEAR